MHEHRSSRSTPQCADELVGKCADHLATGLQCHTTLTSTLSTDPSAILLENLFPALPKALSKRMHQDQFELQGSAAPCSLL